MGSSASSVLRAEDLSDSEEIFDTSKPDNAEIDIDLTVSKNSFTRNIKRMNNKVYDMSSDCRGRCLIINNNHFKNLPDRVESQVLHERIGSDMDVTNLKKVFRSLGFYVILKSDVESQGFTTVIEAELKNPDHEKLGMFVFVLMTHGGKGNTIYRSDGIGIDLHSILKKIYNCELLKDKPKFMVLQACAGDDFSIQSNRRLPTSEVFFCSAVDAKVSESNFDTRICRNPDDVIILKSASEGFVSVRQKHFGSPFIRGLVEALLKHAHHCDLETICKQVQKKVRVFNKMAKRLESDTAPLLEYSTFLRKVLYLLPDGRSATTPTEIQFKSSVGTDFDACRSVKWISDKHMVTGSLQGLQLRDRKLKPLSSVTLNWCFTVVPYQDQLLVLQLFQKTKTIANYTQSLKKNKTIATVPKLSENSQIAATEDTIYATDPRNKRVSVYATNGQRKPELKLHDMTHPSGIWPTRDGGLLISDWSARGAVRKYYVEDYRPAWTSTLLVHPYGIAEDYTGIVFVSGGSYLKSVIYVLSADGLLLNELTCDELKLAESRLLGISVFGDSLTVACGAAGLKLFKVRKMSKHTTTS